MTLATLLGWAGRDTPKCQEEAQPSQAKPHRYTNGRPLTQDAASALPRRTYRRYMAEECAGDEALRLFPSRGHVLPIELPDDAIIADHVACNPGTRSG